MPRLRLPFCWSWWAQVGDWLYDAGAFVKSFIQHLETVELSGLACAKRAPSSPSSAPACGGEQGAALLLLLVCSDACCTRPHTPPSALAAGKALKDTPYIQDALRVIANISMPRHLLQEHVDQASGAYICCVYKCPYMYACMYVYTYIQMLLNTLPLSW